VDDNCIGCGACAERCPYGNIRMHELEPPSRGIVERFLDFLRGDGGQRRPGDSKVQRKAVKCDLCAEYQDYACVTACPVGAAFRVDPRSVLGQGDVLSGGEPRP
ncbi:MAG: 4Fe-4S dicluster domain-containing protein, partial [Polyangiaceae bacterium]